MGGNIPIRPTSQYIRGEIAKIGVLESDLTNPIFSELFQYRRLRIYHPNPMPYPPLLILLMHSLGRKPN